ncbi:hypothetical protein EDD11_008125 [Mortierella claussenii]|nr:hypothetical protein EDD11_008125 [Mortierella claussenii]
MTIESDLAINGVLTLGRKSLTNTCVNTMKFNNPDTHQNFLQETDWFSSTTSEETAIPTTKSQLTELLNVFSLSVISASKHADLTERRKNFCIGQFSSDTAQKTKDHIDHVDITYKYLHYDE